VSVQAKLRFQAAESLLARIRPDRVLELFSERLATLHRRFVDALKRSQVERIRAVDQCHQRLARAYRAEDLQQQTKALMLLSERMRIASIRTVEAAKSKLAASHARLEAVSPQSVLARGYSIVHRNSKHVRSFRDVAAGDAIDIHVVDGLISGVVQAVEGDERE
jgi:exodeoxyribonuclease VII large subunit